MPDGNASFRTQCFKGGDAAQPLPSIMFAERRRLAILGENGFVETCVRTIEGSDIVFGSVRSSGHVIELREPDRLTLLLPRAGRLRVRIGPAEHGVTPGCPMAFRPGERVTDATAGRDGLFAAITLQVPAARVRALAEAAELPLQGLLGPDAVALRARLEASALEGMARLACDLFLRPKTALPPGVALAITDFVDAQLLALMDGRPAPARCRVLSAFHRVRAAEEIMHAHSEEPLSMLELARRLDIGLRSLQLAFREVHDGLSPREVYSRIRLDRARQRLLAASGADRVTTIALDSGFGHLGRFAMAYARTFGELPSETLARRRRI